MKGIEPDALVSYANFPPTEYLDLDFLDFISFNVYLHRENDFRRYLSRLQNLAKDKPLVLTEFGIDSMREGAAEQAQILSWQVRAAFESGVAGTVIFSWTDDWFTGGFQVEDWAFGLVDRERHKKPAYHAVHKLYSGELPPPLEHPPRISVVICAYNAERTMDACLASLRTLRYPNYEVIVVNDGSTDRTLEIAQRYPEVRILSQENKGLSVARNVGIENATGEIVAFTDSDCVVDPDWLTYLAYKFVHSGFVAVGGPNLPPPEEARVPACVAAAPGGPTHVLIDDEVAEHIPGCNMAFLKSALDEIGGFDPIYRAAGDDVDLCWRLQNHGHPIGFSPAAMVWHFRRNTIKAYLKQQMGYGKAEAQLYFKHPFRFNMLGQSQWIGRIYGDLGRSLFSRRPVIYHGVFGRGLFQTLYEPSSSLLSYLPFTLEWNLVGLVMLIGAVVADRQQLLAGLPLFTALIWAGARAWRAKVDPRYDGIGSRLLITALIYLGPLLRSLQRYLYRIQGMTNVARIQFEQALAAGARAMVQAAVLPVLLVGTGARKRESAARRHGVPPATQVPHRRRPGLERPRRHHLPRHLVQGGLEGRRREPRRQQALLSHPLPRTRVVAVTHLLAELRRPRHHRLVHRPGGDRGGGVAARRAQSPGRRRRQLPAGPGHVPRHRNRGEADPADAGRRRGGGVRSGECQTGNGKPEIENRQMHETVADALFGLPVLHFRFPISGFTFLLPRT